MAQLYSQALSSLSVSSYYSQGYGGGIRTRLHTELIHRVLPLFYTELAERFGFLYTQFWRPQYGCVVNFMPMTRNENCC
jgi:hypothetical protein